MTNKDQLTHEMLLKEILPLPAEKSVADRFSRANVDAAGCNGKCLSGTCKAIVM